MHLLAFLLLPIALTQALKFELYAHRETYPVEKCIRNFVGDDTLVVVTAIVSGTRGDGQRVDINVCPISLYPLLPCALAFLLRLANKLSLTGC